MTALAPNIDYNVFCRRVQYHILCFIIIQAFFEMLSHFSCLLSKHHFYSNPKNMDYNIFVRLCWTALNNPSFRFSITNRTKKRSVKRMAHIGVRISKQDKEKLNEIAKETDTTISEITRSLLDKFFKEKEVIKIVLK